MNFDRNYRTHTVQNENTGLEIISKIQKLPIVKRIYLYVFLIAVVGAVMGEVKYRQESTNCMANDDCWTIEPAQRRMRELGVGAIAGIIVATLISIPALLED